MGYSQLGQDDFILKMLNNKKNGTYLEIGAGHPIVENNTYILEKDYGWTGRSIDINQNVVDAFNKIRRNKCQKIDARTIDYQKFFKTWSFPKQIDYLQIDIEPDLGSLCTLLSMPFEEYRFSIITFEHNLPYYSMNKIYKKIQKDLLESFGYVRVREDVSDNSLVNSPVEDWWIDPKVISYPQV